MNQWLNRSHPQTLQAGVILGYISAVFGMLFSSGGILTILVFLGLGGGAFATANNKRWGYLLLASCACIAAFFRLYDLFFGLVDLDPFPFIPTIRERTSSTIANTLDRMNSSVFPAALAVAVLHTQSRQYQKAWFE